MTFDISAGLTVALTDGERESLQAALGTQALAGGDGYVITASTIIQAAGCILVMHMPADQAAKMLRDLADMAAQTIKDNLYPAGRRQ